MNPLFKYLKNVFVSQRILGEDSNLNSLVKADLLLQALVDDKKVPGLAITVLREGKTIFQNGYGYANLDTQEPVNPQKTIFRIASVSKPIAASALVYMVAEGLIDLDASFYKYVPYYPKKKWDFTIRQLAGHTAGIRSYKGKEYGLNKPYTIKESITVFKDDVLLFEPGTDYHYNSFDWVLVSLAMQEASGVPFEVYVKEKVLEPLGMNTTFTPDHPQKKETNVILSPDENLGKPESLSCKMRHIIGSKENITTFYSKNRIGFRNARPVNNFYKLAGGGYLSTSEDIAKLGKAYLDNKILNQEVVTQFLTSQIINNEPTYYGLGWQVSEDKQGRPYYGHVGNGVGGYSNFFVHPKEQMVFSILINCTDPKVQDRLDEIKDLFFV